MDHNFSGTAWGQDNAMYWCSCGGWRTKKSSIDKDTDRAIEEWRAHRDAALQIER